MTVPPQQPVQPQQPCENCNETPESEAVDIDYEIDEPSDSGTVIENGGANSKVQPNPDAPDSGCGGLPCGSPEEEAGIEIETHVDSIPCNGPPSSCGGTNGGDDYVDTGNNGGGGQSNPGLPDQDRVLKLQTVCEISRLQTN